MTTVASIGDVVLVQQVCNITAKRRSEMTKYKIVIAVILALLVSVSAYAANVYKDTFTTEDGDGHWTFTSMTTGKQLENVSIISATPATLTTATSGRTYIADKDGADATIVSITLPPASTTTAKVVYKFVSGDGSGFVIRPADGARDNVFMWALNGSTGVTPVAQKQLRLPVSTPGSNSTGVSIEVRMGSNVWYVTPSTPTTVQVEAVTDLW